MASSWTSDSINNVTNLLPSVTTRLYPSPLVSIFPTALVHPDAVIKYSEQKQLGEERAGWVITREVRAGAPAGA